jgi:hypothetical protein
MKIPTTLKHKPVIVSENYENVDGRYAYKFFIWDFIKPC